MATTQELIEERRIELEEARVEALRVASERIPQRGFGRGVTRKEQQIAIQRGEEAQSNLEEIAKQKKQLQEIETQLRDSEQPRGREDRTKVIRKLALSGKPAFGLNKDERKLFFEIRRGARLRRESSEQTIKFKEQGLTPIVRDGSIVGFRDEVSGQSIPLENIPRFAGSSPEAAQRFERAGVISSQEVVVPKRNIVSIPERGRDPLEKAEFFLRDIVQGTREEGVRSELRIATASFGLSAVGTVSGLRNFAILEDEERKRVVESGARKVATEGLPEVGIILATQPSRSVGTVAFNIVALKAPDLFIKGVDVIRTIKLTELPSKDIIAPEFFSGQAYPKIFRGQTAGQLKQEFFSPITELDYPKVIRLEGRTGTGIEISPTEISKLPFKVDMQIPRGFTASPKSFRANTQIREGSSYLRGGFQAPRLNPSFLEISGERKLLSLNIFGTIRPTAIRIRPIRYSFAPSVNPRTFRILPKNKISQTQDFLDTQANLGEAFIPFFKTEKEAIIPATTEIALEAKRFFFSFEGRRIPILEFKALASTRKGSSKSPSITLNKLYSSFYSKSYPGIINPYSSSLAISKIGSSRPSSSSSVRFSNSYKNISLSSIQKISYGKSSISSRPIISKVSIAYPSFSYSFPPIRSYTPPPSRTTIRIPAYKPPIYPPFIPTRSPPNRRTSPKPNQGKGREFSLGFRSFIIRRGKPKLLGSILPRGLALRAGERAAVKSLGATFGIKKTNVRINKRDITYTPRPELFRSFRIQKGKKIPLVDTFIQKRGKRLSSRFEIEEIQLARRN